MKIAMLSDTHNSYGTLVVPECDILISAGDYSFRGTKNEVINFHKWFAKQPAKHLISVQGNHEIEVEKNFEQSKDMINRLDTRIHFIAEQTLRIEGFKIHCSAVTPAYNNWAWNRERGNEIKKHWDLIPDDIDILVTHGPPFGILDKVERRMVGCVDLLKRIYELRKLRLHVFGHIHYSSGEETINRIRFVNASICDENYKAVNPVRIFEF
jgi:Icc-related predicted phosphoesterase